MMFNEFDFIRTNKSKKICIYGAGKFGNLLRKYLANEGITVDRFIVSNKTGNDDLVNGIKVFSLEEVDYNEDEIVIIVAVNAHQNGIFDSLVKFGYNNLYELPRGTYNKLVMWDVSCKLNALSNTYYMNIYDSFVERGHSVIMDKENNIPLFRVSMVMGFDGLIDIFLKECNFNLFESIFGKFCYIGNDDKAENVNVNTGLEIYEANSVMRINSKTIDREYIIPIMLGDEKKDSQFLCECNGDNISNRNKNYSECSALYWIWKNTSNQKYVGLCHYRRHFNITKKLALSLENSEYDIVTTYPQFTHWTIKDFFVSQMISMDWELLKKYLCIYDAQYKGITDRYEKGHFYIPCNMTIMKREWFDKYCECAFFVSEKIYKWYEKRGIVRLDRYMGYLFENILSMYIIRNKESLKIAYTDMIFG